MQVIILDALNTLILENKINTELERLTNEHGDKLWITDVKYTCAGDGTGRVIYTAMIVYDVI